MNTNRNLKYYSCFIGAKTSLYFNSSLDGLGEVSGSVQGEVKSNFNSSLDGLGELERLARLMEILDFNSSLDGLGGYKSNELCKYDCSFQFQFGWFGSGWQKPHYVCASKFQFQFGWFGRRYFLKVCRPS